MDNVHGAHGTPSVVKNPLRLVRVDTYDGRGIGFCEVCDDVGYHTSSVVRGGGDSRIGELVEKDGIENIPPVLKNVG